MILTLMKIDPFTPLDPDIQLQREIQLEIVDTLRCSLPPPRISTPEAWLRRDRVALAKVAELEAWNVRASHCPSP